MSLLNVPRGAFIAIFVLLVAGRFIPLRADDDVEYVTDQVVVKLNLATGTTITAVNAAYGTTTLETLLGSSAIYLLRIAPGASVESVVDAMKDDPRLIYAEPNFIGHFPEGDPRDTWGWGGTDPAPYLEQYAADLLNLPEAHSIARGDGVVVAVLDTGAQLDHPHLAGRFTSVRYDFIADDAVPADEFNGADDDDDGLTDEGGGHGTHVAGIVHLVAPEAQIMPLRVLNSDGVGNDFLLAEAIQYAVAHGADVLNLSLSTPQPSELLADVVGQAAAAGVVIVAAAGNLNESVEQYPAAVEQAVAVTSVGPTSTKSPFANYGPWVDIAAPGESIFGPFPPSGYAHWSGTSMATGFVSGQAALIRGEFPTLPPPGVTTLIRATARPIDGAGDQMGAGVTDVGASVGVFPDGPATVYCGQILIRSVVVANDLHNCPGDGLIVGADGITINLNGRTLDGTGLGAGIRNDGYDAVAVTNGTLREFDYGALLNPGATGNEFSALTLQLNQEAGALFSGDGNPGGNALRHNAVIDNQNGVLLLNETSASLQGNTIDGNANFGVHLQNANHNTLEANTFLNAGDTALLLEGSSHNTLRNNTVTDSSDAAIALVAGSNGNRVEGNTVIGSSDNGLFMAWSNDNDLLFNVIRYGSDNGIALDNAHDNVLRGNDLRHNAAGIEMNAATRNLIEANDVSHSNGTGIEIQGESLGNIISLNIADANGAMGISVEAEILADSTEPGNRIDRNTAGDNGSRGISVTKPGHTITGNITHNNDSWGIYAETGNIDGGGNIAAGNLEHAQCFNIHCEEEAEPPPPPPPSDTTPPETSINTGPPAAGTATGATFTFSANEPDATFACSLDGAAFTTCASPATYNGLAIGAHTFQVRATDAAGNTDPTPALYQWSVLPDCGAPVTVFATADAWVNQGSKTANKGADTILRVRAKGTANYRALVRFTLPALPPGCVVQSATLHMYAAAAKSNRTLQVLRVNASWSENTVTWKNQPATTGAAATTPSGVGYRQWNVTAHTQAMYSSGAHHGFLIRDATEGGTAAEQQFRSRENAANRPMLVITFAPAGN